MTDAATLARGIEAYQEEREKENAPMRQRLRVVDDLLADNRRQLERLLDLYLSGGFSKEALVDRKVRLEATIGALDRERASLAARLEAQVLTPGQIQSLQEFAANVGRGLNWVEADFAQKRRLIEELNVWGELVVENGQKLVRVSCIMGKGVCSLHPVPLLV
jgi:hypothetical protein